MTTSSGALISIKRIFFDMLSIYMTLTASWSSLFFNDENFEVRTGPQRDTRIHSDVFLLSNAYGDGGQRNSHCQFVF